MRFINNTQSTLDVNYLCLILLSRCNYLPEIIIKNLLSKSKMNQSTFIHLHIKVYVINRHIIKFIGVVKDFFFFSYHFEKKAPELKSLNSSELLGHYVTNRRQKACSKCLYQIQKFMNQKPNWLIDPPTQKSDKTKKVISIHQTINNTNSICTEVGEGDAQLAN